MDRGKYVGKRSSIRDLLIFGRVDNAKSSTARSLGGCDKWETFLPNFRLRFCSSKTILIFKSFWLLQVMIRKLTIVQAFLFKTNVRSNSIILQHTAVFSHKDLPHRFSSLAECLKISSYWFYC